MMWGVRHTLRTCWLLVLLVAACGSEGSKRSVEERIRGQVERQSGKTVTSLTCPKEASRGIEAGLVCVAAFEGGEEASVEVVGTGLAGGIDLRIEGESPGEQLALRITKALGERYGVEFETTECPRAQVRMGLSFECVATTREGAKLPVVARWTDNRGSYEFADKGVIVMKDVEAALSAQIDAAGTPGAVDCPGVIRASAPGSQFDCSIAYREGKRGFAVVTVADWSGRVSWEYE